METKKSEDGEFEKRTKGGGDDSTSTSSNNSDNESDTNEEILLPAISPVSNSSGIFSSGSASSSSFASKPTTPTNLQLTDKSDDDYPCPINSNNKTADEIILVKDNAEDIEELVKRCDSEQIESDSWNNKHSSSIGASSSSKATSSTPKSVKIRSKHRQSRKHISMDDEIVIYESDSSLQIDPRRRNIHAMYSSRSNHQMNRSAVTAISRRKSEENSTSQPSNNIVSILKRKDSSTSSNASLVTFSPNVIDMEPTSRRPTHRQGILKKRSSLDESLRFSRSHSPSSASSAESEKGCLVKSTRRRNSSEELNHHGILKQKSYDSSGGGSAAGYSSGIGGSSGGYNTPNSVSSVQGILKKPSLTPSDPHDQPTKHVSISEAVILAAAELCKDMIIIDDGQSEYIKPILKMDNEHSQPERRPKPILKKNHSTENEEIRSILKSRKSSREESFQDDL